jgi:hypothetical protein
MNRLFRYGKIIAFPVAVIWLHSCTGQNGSQPDKGPGSGTFSENTSSQAVISFDTVSHDFGTIIEGERIVCYFGRKFDSPAYNLSENRKQNLIYL